MGDRRQVVKGSGLVNSRRELSEVDLSVTAKAIRRSLQVLELGEKEYQATSFTGVGRGNVEVERARDGGAHGTIVGSTSRGIGRGGVNRDNQVGILVAAGGKSGGARAARGSSCCGGSRCRAGGNRSTVRIAGL